MHILSLYAFILDLNVAVDEVFGMDIFGAIKLKEKESMSRVVRCQVDYSDPIGTQMLTI